MSHRFQVHLGGVIALLSDHLYAQPGVFVRELLQNAADAVTARRHLQPGFNGAVHMHLSAGLTPLLHVDDDGIGLTEADIHRFLATIGASSKRDELDAHRHDFIGRFGIGLLSCFMVCDEIRLLTRSAHPGGLTWQWCGRRDGTYELQRAASELAQPGTRVTLVPRPHATEAFSGAALRERLLHFGRHLPVELWLHAEAATTGTTVDHATSAANLPERLDSTPPWRTAFATPSQQRKAWLAYGQATLDDEFVDVIALHSGAGDVVGAAFVLAQSPHYGTRPRHRVYLKGMLLSDAAENLLPSWAFFVRCIVDAAGLEPNAAREALHEDGTLSATRLELGAVLKRYWEDLATHHPNALGQLIELHGLSVRALALDDDDFYRLVCDALPFETSQGPMTLGECRRHAAPLRYVSALSQFRQMAPIAAAQGLCLLNAAYTYDLEVLERLPHVMGTAVQAFTASDLPHSLVQLTEQQQRELQPFLAVAAATLEPLGLQVAARSFAPDDIPVLLSQDEQQRLLAALRDTQQASDELFAGLIDDVLSTDAHPAPEPLVCFNYRNPVVRRLATLADRDLCARIAELLYAQSVLLAQRPLRAADLRMMNHALLALLRAQLDIGRLLH